MVDTRALCRLVCILQVAAGMRPQVVGIGGATASGKSSLALGLRSRLGLSQPVVCLDDFYTGVRTFLTPERALADDLSSWETPAVFDFEGFHNQILETREAAMGAGDSHIIAEGFLLFTHRPTVAVLDRGIFLEVSKDESLARRTRRRDDECDPELVRIYHDRHAWPGYLKHRRESTFPDDMLFLDADRSPEAILQDAFSWLVAEGTRGAGAEGEAV